MKVSVDRELCEAHGVCMSLDPDVFDLSDDDVLEILQEAPSEEKRSVIEQAVIRCPRQALSLQE
jgi:ferredoxin